MREQDQRGSHDALSEVPLATVKPLLQGSMSSEPTVDGFIPVRLPESAWARVPNLWAREMYRMAAGVRLSFVTAASSFELDVRASVMAIAGGLLPEVPVTFDLFVDGVDHGAYELGHAAVRCFDVSREPVVVDETSPQQVTLRFDGLGSEEKAIELWFPANAVVEITACVPQSLSRPQHCRRDGGSIMEAQSVTAEKSGDRRGRFRRSPRGSATLAC